MTPNEYQNLAMRTNDGNSSGRVLKALTFDFPDVGGILKK